MDRNTWEKMLICFQAHARGFLMRKEIRRAREDFEDIVKEIDGGLIHLVWSVEKVIPIPHFTDTEVLSLRPSSSKSKSSKPELDVCISRQGPSGTAPFPLESDDTGLPQKIEAERDDSQTKEQASLCKEHFPNSNVREYVNEHKDTTVVEKDGGLMESTAISTTTWSSLDLDMNDGQSDKVSRPYVLAQEVPLTPEALRLHRNTLTMELLWIQQAIDSRKKFLSMQQQLSAS